jgi:hypothetical protein
VLSDVLTRTPLDLGRGAHRVGLYRIRRWKLPSVGEALGRGIAEFRRSSHEDETGPPSPPATSNKG